MPGLVPATTNARRRKKESSNTTSPNSTTHASGWDHPPAVASPSSLDINDENYGSWNPRTCHWKTPQRLFTLYPFQKSNPRQNDEQQPKDFEAGNVFCAPIVVCHKYVLIASDGNISVYGKFNSRDRCEESIPPLTKFSLYSDTDGSFDFGDKIFQMSFHEETKIVYVLTVESSIFQVKLIIDELATHSSSSNIDVTAKSDLGSRNREIPSVGSKGDSGSLVISTNPAMSQPPRLYLMHSWVTKKLGATCMATLNDGGGIGIDTVCVGYKSGHIEAWNVHRIHARDPKYAAQHRGRHTHKKSDQGFSLDWEGFLHDSIRTLSFLSRCNNPQIEGSPTIDTSRKSKDSDNKLGTTSSHREDSIESAGKAEDQYLMTIVSISTRMGDKGKQQSTSSMLKILDLKRIGEQMKIKTDVSLLGLSLEKYSVPQSRGMELIEASTVSLSKNCRLPKRVPILDSHGADAACDLKSVGPRGEENQESSSCTGITFPDAISCLFSSSSQEKFHAVGVGEVDHQVLLSYPSIGNGQVDIVDENGKLSSYFAACLRGGTCYLIPISTKNKNGSIATIPFPHDIESDLSDIYVQAFTAGNLIVDEIDLPILVFAWPGGIIDVYACGLMDLIAPKSDETEIVDDINDILVSRAERRCLQDLIDNECIALLSKIFSELRESSPNPLLQTEEWQQLLTETKAGKTVLTSVEDITLESLCSIGSQSLRHILLSLALANE